MQIYFAYGSNMCTNRLRRRVPGSRFRAIGELPGYRLTFAKLGRDGSGKCTIEPTTGAVQVYGVLFEIPPAEKRHLDAAEGLGSHYRQIEVAVRAGGMIIPAFTYIAHLQRLRPGLRPFTWYKNFVLQGAMEHGLPAGYIAMLSRTPALADPDPLRCRRNRAILENPHP